MSLSYEIVAYLDFYCYCCLFWNGISLIRVTSLQRRIFIKHHYLDYVVLIATWNSKEQYNILGHTGKMKLKVYYVKWVFSGVYISLNTIERIGLMLNPSQCCQAWFSSSFDYSLSIQTFVAPIWKKVLSCFCSFSFFFFFFISII